ncbi:MAG TPA: hypothetical protein VLT86_11965 [Vicinamibacterales bacterium]|nr:hypothetical protein [Vicinamibacterales bacterium]
MHRLWLELGTARPDISRAREGSVWRDLDGEVCGRSYLEGDLRVLDWLDAGTFAFTRHSPVVQVWPARGVSFDAAAAEFDHMVRPIVLQALGSQALHAGAALTPAGAVLLCGRSGAGKSTLSYALGRAGHRQLADDQVVWRLDEGVPVVQPLPFQSRLRARSREHFARSRAVTPLDAREAQVIPILAIYLLEQRATGAGPTEVESVEPAHAFSTLLPHAHCFDVMDAGATGRFANDYLTLVEQTPVYALSYAPDLSRLPELIDAVLSTVEAATVRAC